jgi:flagellar hook assembly protein FlgD
VRFAATLSTSLAWTVRVLDAAGTTIASKAGTGTSVAWTWDGRSAAGAPVAPGVAASWSIDAQDAAGNRALPATGGLLGTTAPIEQGSTSAVTVAPTSISPDGDGQADAATVTFSVASPSTVTVTVQDDLGSILSTVLPPTPVAAGPMTLNWSGAAVDPGTTVPDGAYRVVVTSTDAGGVASSSSAPISVVRAATGLTGPLLAVSPNDDGRGDSASFHWVQTEPSRATLRIMSASAPLATVLESDLPAGPAHAVWNGDSTTRLLSGSLGAVLTLTTEAGQQVLQTTFEVDLTPPASRGLQARTRDGAGFVRFRLSEPGYVQLRVQGHPIGGYLKRKAGANGIRYHLRGRRARKIELRLLDLAGNAGHARIILRR